MRILTAIGVGAVAIAFGVVAGGIGAASRAAGPAAAIARVWTEFFDGSTPAARKIQLLQDGSRFRAVIVAQSKSALARQTKAKVSRVTLLSSTRARVVYTIFLAGQPALPRQVGLAVRVGGAWRVSDHSFCGLLRLQGTSPPACRGI